jgi:hypothetical protein
MKHLAGLATSQSRSQWDDGPTESRLDQSVAEVETGSRLLPRTKAWLDTSRAGVESVDGIVVWSSRWRIWDLEFRGQAYDTYRVCTLDLLP